jgi:hypothetical protein
VRMRKVLASSNNDRMEPAAARQRVGLLDGCESGCDDECTGLAEANVTSTVLCASALWSQHLSVMVRPSFTA